MNKDETLKRASFETRQGVKILKIQGSPYEMGYLISPQAQQPE
jgi:hypothetical protein